MDAADRALLDETLRDAMAAHMAADGKGVLDDVLTQLGWLEMLESEPRDAIDIVFTALGTTNGTSTVLDDVIVAALGAKPRADLAVLLPRFASSDCPGRIDGSDACALGLTTARVGTAAELLVACDAGERLAAITVPTQAVEVTLVRGVDPGAGLCTVGVERVGADAAGLERTAWESAVAAGRRAVAHQIAGACRTMLGLARVHALERVQFGRPIARFQAVRHRLAETLVAIEALEATLTAAWDEPGPVTAALAKATAGRTARTVATQCQQVLAGIGFTTDHPFHQFLKRTMALEGLFGAADDIVVELGARLLDTRSVPTLIEL